MRVVVQLTEQEWQILQELADLERRPPKYQAEYLLSKALSDCSQNTKGLGGAREVGGS
jgi:hypothetical protein